MIQIVATITLDVLKPAIHPIVVYAKQFDTNSRYVCVRVTQNDAPIKIESTSDVYLSGTRIDKKKQAFKGTVNEEGTILIPLDQWLLQLVGSVECDVLIQSGASTITTMSFMVVVLESSYPASTEEDEGGDGNGAVTPILPQYSVASLGEVKYYLGV